jgi:hypothetical protein
MKWNEILREKKMKIEVLHITELHSYLEGKPNINKAETFNKIKANFSVRFRNNSL